MKFKTYAQFIEYCKSIEDRVVASGAYTEKHHILPRCLGGTDDSHNLITLTASDHLRAHFLLAKENGHHVGIQKAFYAMMNQKSKRWLTISEKEVEEYAKVYSASREAHAQWASSSATIRFKNKSYEELYGKERAESLRKLRSMASKGKNNKGEANPMFGKSHSEEARRKQSLAKQRMPTVTCDTCGVTGRGSNMTRYHFRNCKEKLHETSNSK